MFTQEPLAQHDDTYGMAQPGRVTAPSLSLLAMLPTVQDAQGLANQITCNTTTIVLDKTAFRA
jgi:hypothetical protein